ncbi:MAG TPA: prepilin-type N-terminal cleavage/methylation domain-containing protein [Syntrophales bacterium]|nr:prepilin-type N-terminal cleavage/methylation domain-containing protein [Syntrophales bacterium]
MITATADILTLGKEAPLKEARHKGMFSNPAVAKEAGSMKFRNKNGFSLIEFSIALFMVTIVLLGMAAHLGTSLKVSSHDRNYTTASNLLQDKMETIRQLNYLQVLNGSDSVAKNGVTFNRNWTCSTNGNLKTVALSITWGSKVINSSLVLAER